jgi:hypothetical protein
MHAHDYLKLRRRAAGLTIDVAQLRLDHALYGGGGFAGIERRGQGEDFEYLRDPCADMVRLEAGLSIAGTRELSLIRVHVYPIDPVIYLHLGMGGTPHICRFCGCTTFDACFNGHATCAWSGPDLCTSPTCLTADLKEKRRAA